MGFIITAVIRTHKRCILINKHIVDFLQRLFSKTKDLLNKPCSALVGSATLIFVLTIAVISTYMLSMGSSSNAGSSISIRFPNSYVDDLICFNGLDIPKFEQARFSNATIEVNEEIISQKFVMSDLSTLKYGESDKRVNTLQCRLDELGFLNIDELTEYYGPATRQAVLAFQRQHGLKQTGTANTKTLTLMFDLSAQKYNLTEGTSGEDVRDLQEQLCDLAYMEKSTGFFGELTTAVLKDFQERNDFVITGKFDSDTIDLLYMPEAVAGENYAKQLRRKARIETFIEVAREQLGKPYSSGSRGPNRFDCSGLVHYCLSEAGSNRRRLSASGYSQVSDWEKITSMNDLQIGDLLFFYNSRGSSRVGHVGIYIGNGYMIDASSSEGEIVKRSCRTSHWRSLFLYARRPW